MVFSVFGGMRGTVRFGRLVEGSAVMRGRAVNARLTRDWYVDCKLIHG